MSFEFGIEKEKESEKLHLTKIGNEKKVTRRNLKENRLNERGEKKRIVGKERETCESKRISKVLSKKSERDCRLK